MTDEEWAAFQKAQRAAVDRAFAIRDRVGYTVWYRAMKIAWRAIDIAYSEIGPNYVSLEDALDSMARYGYGRCDMDYHGHLQVIAGGLGNIGDDPDDLERQYVRRALEIVGKAQFDLIVAGKLRGANELDLPEYLLRHSLAWPTDPDAE